MTSAPADRATSRVRSVDPSSTTTMCASGTTTPTCLITSPTVSCSFNAGMTTSTRSSGTSFTVSQQRPGHAPVAREQRIEETEPWGSGHVHEGEPARPHRREVSVGASALPLRPPPVLANDTAVPRYPRVAPQLLDEPALLDAEGECQQLEQQQRRQQHQQRAQLVERQQVEQPVPFEQVGLLQVAAELVVMVRDSCRLISDRQPSLPREHRQIAVLVVGEPLLGKPDEAAPDLGTHRECRPRDGCHVAWDGMLLGELAEVSGPDETDVVQRVAGGVQPGRVVSQPDAGAGKSDHRFGDGCLQRRQRTGLHDGIGVDEHDRRPRCCLRPGVAATGVAEVGSRSYDDNPRPALPGQQHVGVRRAVVHDDDFVRLCSDGGETVVEPRLMTEGEHDRADGQGMLRTWRTRTRPNAAAAATVPIKNPSTTLVITPSPTMATTTKAAAPTAQPAAAPR